MGYPCQPKYLVAHVVPRRQIPVENPRPDASQGSGDTGPVWESWSTKTLLDLINLSIFDFRNPALGLFDTTYVLVLAFLPPTETVVSTVEHLL
ncbi:hypothetical protein EIP91_000048 [Steccherinum ochraceum]|uniref:Uncharacterized protein n=1 Tax=Steccherinum ochraceum TaxID=92696 RepID=A0A4R0RUY8_9APHY|nr:hypothetical protein EIP91_000048 [Steccherinum ochraceum]